MMQVMENKGNEGSGREGGGWRVVVAEFYLPSVHLIQVENWS